MDIGFSALKGMTLTKVERLGDDSIVFTEESGRTFTMQHHQDCCEAVYIESVTGDLADLVGNPILLAEETSNDKNPEGQPVSEYQNNSFTWTFYKLATIKGYVDIRWYGESNGYYSESVDFEETTP